MSFYVVNMSVIEQSADYPSQSKTKLDPAVLLPKEIMIKIFSYLWIRNLEACWLVNKQWNQLSNDDSLLKPIVQQWIAFGKEKWSTYFGDVDKEVPLPSRICSLLRKPCPFFPDKVIGQTHFLLLIPQTVNGKPLTLKRLVEFAKKPKEGGVTGFQDTWDTIKKEWGDIPVEGSYWLLITKNIVPGSFEQSYEEEKRILDKYSHQTWLNGINLDYKMPRLIEAAASIFAQHVKNPPVLHAYPFVYTFCKEKVSGDKGQLLSIYGDPLTGVVVRDSNRYGWGLGERYFKQTGTCAAYRFDESD